MALRYQRPEDGPLAARLLAMLDFVETQDLLLPKNTHFYRFIVDGRHQSRGDGILYLSVVPDAQRDLVDAVRDAPKIGIAGEYPAVAIMREHIADGRKPEVSRTEGSSNDHSEPTNPR